LVFHAEVDFGVEVEAGLLGFVDDVSDGAADVVEGPFAAVAFDASEVDDDKCAAGFEGFVDGGEGVEGVFEMVVYVADEGDVDGIFGEFDGAFIADDGFDVFLFVFA